VTAPAQVLPTTLCAGAREGRPVAWASRVRPRPCCAGSFEGAVANLWEGSWLNPRNGQRELNAALGRPGPHHRDDPGMSLPVGQRYRAVVRVSDVTRGAVPAAVGLPGLLVKVLDMDHKPGSGASQELSLSVNLNSCR
jgi:hypothetical protein